MPKLRKPIFLTGGGTLGPVTPVLAIYEAWKKEDPDQEFVWIGTPGGPERELIRETDLKFHSLLVPKAYRYLTFKWLLLPPLLLWSVSKSIWLLARYRPSWVLSAGAYVSVPLALLANFFGTRVAIHQLDYKLGLANKLMAPVSTLVTSTWEVTKKHLSRKDVQVVGGLAYKKHISTNSRESSYEKFDLDSSKKTVLIVGGGGGSRAINSLAESVADKLSHKFNVLHATGSGKKIFRDREAPENYYVTDLFIEDYAQALDLADVVVTRAGIGQLEELVVRKKASIFIPIPHSAQEENAQAILDAHAGVVLNQVELTGNTLIKSIHETLESHTKKRLEENIGNLFPKDGARRIVELIKQKNTRG